MINKIKAIVREAINLPEDTEIEFVGPQFERKPEDPKPTEYPGHDVLATLHEATPATLLEFGLRRWSCPEQYEEGLDPEAFRTGTLWVLPGEWYPHLPKKFVFMDICGNAEEFQPVVSDDDIRFGCLPYGIYVSSST